MSHLIGEGEYYSSHLIGPSNSTPGRLIGQDNEVRAKTRLLSEREEQFAWELVNLSHLPLYW
jgi:hypothetical protein